MPELLIKVSIFLSFDLSTIILAISHIKKIILALFIISLNWNHPRWSDMYFFLFLRLWKFLSKLDIDQNSLYNNNNLLLLLTIIYQ